MSDRGPVFTSTFWRELFRLVGVKLRMTSAFHPSLMANQRQQTRSLLCTSNA